MTIYPSKTAGSVGTQVHLVERTIRYHPGEGEVEQLLVSKHDFSAKTTESSDIPLSPCLSKFVTVTIKNPVFPPFQQIFLPDSRWSRDQPQPGSVFQRLREAEKRDPGNEVVRKMASCSY